MSTGTCSGLAARSRRCGTGRNHRSVAASSHRCHGPPGRVGNKPTGCILEYKAAAASRKGRAAGNEVRRLQCGLRRPGRRVVATWPDGDTAAPAAPRHPRAPAAQEHPATPAAPRHPRHRDTATQRDAATLRGTATPRDLATPRHSATLRRWASATFRRRTAWSASTPRPRQPQRPGWSAPTPPGCCSLLPSAPRKAAWSRQRP